MDEDNLDLDQQNAELDTATSGESEERPKSARELAMEQVLASRAAAEAAELEQHRRDLRAQGLPVEEEVSNAPSGEGREEEGEDEDALQRALQDEQAAPKIVENLDQTMVKIKVDGEERTVPLADIVRTAQKHEAADKRLAEATRMLEEAKARAAAAPAAAVAAVDSATEQLEQGKPDTVDKPRQDPTEQVKEFLNAMFQGDEERATEILSGLVKASPPPQETAPSLPDPDQIAAQVEASLERRSALKQFATAYPEILKDQDLATLADLKLQRRLAAGETFSDAIMAVGDEVYLKSGHKRPAAAEEVSNAPTPSQREARLERKKSSDIVRGRSVGSSSLEPESESPADVIAEMQAARAHGRWAPSGARR